ncbi:hypothetical protein [Nocardia fluminea]|uniref:hypothetical protein n=1 Tax=Nocardia fluminea TaxID=134984 RepID=UPI0033FD049C
MTRSGLLTEHLLPATWLGRIGILARYGWLSVGLLAGPGLADHGRRRERMLPAPCLSRSGLLPLLPGPVGLLPRPRWCERLPEYGGWRDRMLSAARVIRPRLRAVLRSGRRLLGWVAGRAKDGGVSGWLRAGVGGWA